MDRSDKHLQQRARGLHAVLVSGNEAGEVVAVGERFRTRNVQYHKRSLNEHKAAHHGYRVQLASEIGRRRRKVEQEGARGSRLHVALFVKVGILERGLGCAVGDDDARFDRVVGPHVACGFKPLRHRSAHRLVAGVCKSLLH